jgi:hypothetical protein
MATEKTELRGLVSNHLASALDAIAMARNLDRHAYVVAVLEAEVKKVAHENSVLVRTMRGNPYFTESDTARSD